MIKLLIAILLFAGFGPSNYTDSITGKWQVERVDLGEFETHITVQQKASVAESFKSSLINSVFNFRSDHQFFLTANLKNMPQGNNWTYDVKKRIIKIANNKDKGTIMLISVVEKNDTTFFMLQETPVVLKMRKADE